MQTPRSFIDQNAYLPESTAVADLIAMSGLTKADRVAISNHGARLVEAIRSQAKPTMMEVFLAEYGLSTEEGVALMCLAEALLRTPDVETIDALIEDKIKPSDWGKHMGHSTSPLVNASTWGLMLTGKVLKDEASGVVGHLRGAVKRLGEPVIRGAVSRAMKEMGRQFVLGEDIEKAIARAGQLESKGYSYSYDMLGEAAKTESDARRYHLAYSRTILAAAEKSASQKSAYNDIRQNPGISVKLSALHPRYEVAQRARVMDELVPRLRTLALLAKSAGIGMNIDAEESSRLALSMDVIETVLSEPALAGWGGFGVVVQAYGKRASHVIDYLYELAKKLDRRIMLRLVKGAYWDTEIKIAQVAGLAEFPVFTNQAATNVSYIVNVEKLLTMTDFIYPQFATHNAHSMAAALHIAKKNNIDAAAYEFQRLHGMGEALHDIVKSQENTGCRIYAPVGPHQDLLAYLVRRLLENGANSSFVNQITDKTLTPQLIARDPFEADLSPASIKKGVDIFQPERKNSRGFDLDDRADLDLIEAARLPFKNHQWSAKPSLETAATRQVKAIINPADPSDNVGHVHWSTIEDTAAAFQIATPWIAAPQVRKSVLHKAADLYEEHFGELFALLHREAGKTLMDSVAELREGVDFLRYYAENIPDGQESDNEPCGRFVCISPWNFPLAIFTGQIAAALATGNAVVAKSAEQTPLIAARLVALLHEAGVPRDALIHLTGDGEVGAAITCSPLADGVAFTGSTATAKHIHTSMAKNLAPEAPLIAETGGLNAMIIDSTALFEQGVTAVIESAFQSAGQRCSALRCLYVQDDIAEDFTTMLIGAMDELIITDPWDIKSDSGPVIDQAAHTAISAYIQNARAQGRIIHETPSPNQGFFISPTLIAVQSIQDMKREIFGPVLHLATFKSDQVQQIIDDINATGYGLTFGLQTRINDRVQGVSDRIKAGNIYVNRNQIGAVVGSQPFGGEGLSGTGPKAGGGSYLLRFIKNPPLLKTDGAWGAMADLESLQQAIDDSPPRQGITENLPGPTGEANQLNHFSKPPILCLGPGLVAAAEQAEQVASLGGVAVMARGAVNPQELIKISGIGGVVWWGDAAASREIAKALAQRGGAILRLITGRVQAADVMTARHICIDTTASGGNASLLSGKG